MGAAVLLAGVALAVGAWYALKHRVPTPGNGSAQTDPNERQGEEAKSGAGNSGGGDLPPKTDPPVAQRVGEPRVRQRPRILSSEGR